MKLSLCLQGNRLVEFRGEVLKKVEGLTNTHIKVHFPKEPRDRNNADAIVEVS